MPIDAHEQNRLSWNTASERHNLHKGDQARFFREGGTTLYPEDLDVIGDARGRSLLHLQCNCGQDSLSIAAHLGAAVSGVDISDKAIAFARRLSEESGIPASFERADIFDWCKQRKGELFDIVYTSYGVLGWLSDIERWGRCVAQMIKPGGRFGMVEFHPTLLMLDEDDPDLHKYDYMGGALIEEPEGVGDYVELSGDSFKLGTKVERVLPEFRNPHPAMAYPWGLGETIDALLKAGMQIESLQEYAYSNGWQPFPEMRDLSGGRKSMPEGRPNLPMMFSVVANKPFETTR